MQEYLDKWHEIAIPTFGAVYGDNVRFDTTINEYDNTDIDVIIRIMNFEVSFKIADYKEDTDKKFQMAAMRIVNGLKDLIVAEYLKQWREQVEEIAE